jgi:TPR repeat protein
MNIILRHLLHPAGRLLTVLPVRPLQAVSWLRHSLFSVALCATASAVHADFDAELRAVKLRLYHETSTHFLPEAQVGNPTAALYFAHMYRRGYGTSRDMTMATQWYRCAAEQNEPSGMFSLGVHLRDGIGVSANQDAATQWFEKAARSGHTAGTLNFGMLMFNGKGIERD